MKRPTLLEGALFALVASLGGSIAFTALSGVLPGGSLLRLLLAGFGFAYVVYLLGRSRERVGRVVVVAAWLIVAAMTWWLSLPLPFYLLIHLGMVWLVRSLYHQGGVLSALADLGLLALGLGAGLWALTHTGSVFLGVWCFFLVQSIFALIPSDLARRPAAPGDCSEDEQRFDRAFRQAESALCRLHSIH